MKKELYGPIVRVLVGFVMLTLASGCTSANMKTAETRYVAKHLNTHYMTDDDGNILLDVPPVILRSVVDQVSASGDIEAVNAVQQLYDFDTGHVRDEAHARSIGELLKDKGR